MKKIVQYTRQLGLAILLGAAFQLAACSTGTGDGETNVERGSAKDKNPEAQNVPEGTEGSSTAADSAGNSDDPDANKTYQKVDPDNGARDADNDGQVDQ